MVLTSNPAPSIFNQYSLSPILLIHRTLIQFSQFTWHTCIPMPLMIQFSQFTWHTCIPMPLMMAPLLLCCVHIGFVRLGFVPVVCNSAFLFFNEW
jgi:hypothetical protein